MQVYIIAPDRHTAVMIVWQATGCRLTRCPLQAGFNPSNPLRVDLDTGEHSLTEIREALRESFNLDMEIGPLPEPRLFEDAELVRHRAVREMQDNWYEWETPHRITRLRPADATA
jgi:hypothetical protein